VIISQVGNEEDSSPPSSFSYPNQS